MEITHKSSTMEWESEELELDDLKDEEDNANGEASDMEVTRSLKQMWKPKNVAGPVANHPNQQNEVTVTMWMHQQTFQT